MLFFEQDLVLTHPFFKGKTQEELLMWKEALESSPIEIKDLLKNPDITDFTPIPFVDKTNISQVPQDLQEKILYAQNNPGKMVSLFLEEGSKFVNDVIYLQYRPQRVFDWGHKIKYEQEIALGDIFELDALQIKKLRYAYERINSYDYCEISQERFTSNIMSFIGNFQVASQISQKLSEITPGSKVKIWKNIGENVWQCFAETKQDLEIDNYCVEYTEIERPHYRSWANKSIKAVLQQVTADFRYQPIGKVFNPSKKIYQVSCSFDQTRKNKVREYFLASQGYAKQNIFKFEDHEMWLECVKHYSYNHHYISPINPQWEFPLTSINSAKVVDVFNCKPATHEDIKSQLPHLITAPSGKQFYLSAENYKAYKSVRNLLNQKFTSTVEDISHINEDSKHNLGIWKKMMKQWIPPYSTEYQFMRHFSPLLEVKEKSCAGYEAQPGPRSEQGRILFSSSPAKIVQLIEEQEWGKVKQFIPSSLPTVGRYHSLLDEEEGMLKIPFAHKIFHGITGAKNPYVSIERLRTILQSGALKSISERRWHGISIHSLSPLGDIASGVDKGVPCKIGLRPSFGDGVYIAIKPESLYRQELWFSDQDFGPGESRYSKYLQYAKSLGCQHHEDIHPVEIRQKHLDNCAHYHYNEVWFKHSVPLADFEAIYFDDMFTQKKELKELCKEFKIPVYSFTTLQKQTCKHFASNAEWKEDSENMIKKHFPERIVEQLQLKL